MNGPFQTAQQPTVNAVPVELEVLAPPALLLPGESREHYQAPRQAIFAGLARDPRSNGCSRSISSSYTRRSCATARCATNCWRPSANRRSQRSCAASIWSASRPSSPTRPSTISCRTP
jgi:hypothetical protein